MPIAFLVPSSSGHAALVMPILAPLADFAGVARSVASPPTSRRPGFVNCVTPTSAVVMGGLALAKVGYDRYLRFVAAVPGASCSSCVCIFIGDRRRPGSEKMRVVVALGGNALLRRGEQMTVENQRENVAIGLRRAGADGRAHNELSSAHGNGPQVGLLALQAAAYETERMSRATRSTSSAPRPRG